MFDLDHTPGFSTQSNTQQHTPKIFTSLYKMNVYLINQQKNSKREEHDASTTTAAIKKKKKW